MSSWDKIISGQYEDALADLNLEIADTPSRGALNNRGLVFLHLGHHEKAFDDFTRANVGSDGSMCGMALWMGGYPEQALGAWMHGLQATIRGEVEYDDGGRGVSVAALVFFAGVRLSDSKAIKAASSFLRKRSKSKNAEHWPGVISKRIVGLISDAELIASTYNPRSSNLMRRQLCRAHFWCGVMALFAGDELAYNSQLKLAFEFGRTFKVEREYYLAYHELRRATSETKEGRMP